MMVRDEQARGEVDQGRGDRQEGLHDGVETLADHLLADLKANEALVLPLVAADVAGLVAEHLGQQHAGYREGSSVIALMPASDSWVDRDTLRRRSPTALVSQKNAGTVTTATMVSCQLMMIMATILETNVPTVARIVEAVLVTTVSTPPTSLASRDWISPVLVFVKKASGRVSRCAYSRLRRSRMTSCPTRVVW